MAARLTLAVLLAAAVPSFAEDAADLILRNGRFYPVVPPGAVEGSLAVRDGRIVYLGPDEGAAEFQGADTQVVELAGRTATPGLIDAHSHLISLGRALSEVDLVGTTSYEEVIERVRARAQELPPGSWVNGRGWDQNDWQVKEFPAHQALSAAVPNHPVWMRRIDGHAALLNRRAMELLRLDDSIEDPPGGRLLRDRQGRLTGVLIDDAMTVARARMRTGESGGPGRGAGEAATGDTASADEISGWILAGARHCLKRGLTTVTDMGVDQREVDAYAGLRSAGRLPLRAALFLSDEPQLLGDWLERGPEIDPQARLQVRAVKMYSDGALGSRGAALVEEYSDDPQNFGLLRTSSDHIHDVCNRALAAGFQVGIHAIGDRGNLVSLEGIERCFGEPRPEARFRIEHAQVMRLRDIRRMAELGVIASMQPTHATSDMPWAEDRVGPVRLQGAYAWRRVIDAGGRLALGSDFPVELVDPTHGLYAAVTRQDQAGYPVGGWLPDQRLDRPEALRGFTLDAAYSLFLDDEVGSLELGKRADLTVFARDIMTVPASEIPEVEIDMTLVDGVVAFHREGAP
jgi:predicted amidohydrolase YtcJ